MFAGVNIAAVLLDVNSVIGKRSGMRGGHKLRDLNCRQCQTNIFLRSFFLGPRYLSMNEAFLFSLQWRRLLVGVEKQHLTPASPKRLLMSVCF